MKTRRESARKHLRSSTLIETVLATAILAVLGGGIIGAVNYGMFIMRVTRENQRATQVMLEKLESVRLYKWDQVISNGFVPVSFTDSYDPQTPDNPGITYYGTLSIDTATFTANTPSYATNMRQFTVTLYWTNAGRIPHTRKFITYVSRDGMQNYVY